MVRRVRRLLAAALLGCTGLVAVPAAAEARPPNIVVIVADDLGYGDVSAYSASRAPTPNIDRLAASGVRFTDGYATAAVCAPSRAALLTGRQQSRYGWETNPPGGEAAPGVDPAQPMIGQVLKPAGYATAMVGKWHLGQQAGFHPMDRGFDEYFGVLDGATEYWRAKQPGDVGLVTAVDSDFTRAGLPIYRGRERVEVDGYLTDIFTREAADFIARNRERPFFLYLAYTAPHTPLQAPSRYLTRAPSQGREMDRIYDAMLLSLDDGVGRILETLEAQGLRRDTIVVFLSDNGCPAYLRGACSNGPLSGHKASLAEGGVRVPFIISWPRSTRPRVSAELVSSLDILPTLAAAAGAPVPAGREGVNLLPHLRGQSAVPPRALFWRAGPAHAARLGDWKLIEDRGTRLYDLKADPGEQHDLAADNPAAVARLRARYVAWDRDNLAPAPARPQSTAANDLPARLAH